jgi:hypothetical protein
MTNAKINHQMETIILTGPCRECSLAAHVYRGKTHAVQEAFLTIDLSLMAICKFPHGIVVAANESDGRPKTRARDSDRFPPPTRWIDRNAKPTMAALASIAGTMPPPVSSGGQKNQGTAHGGLLL